RHQPTDRRSSFRARPVPSRNTATPSGPAHSGTARWRLRRRAGTSRSAKQPPPYGRGAGTAPRRTFEFRRLHIPEILLRLAEQRDLLGEALLVAARRDRRREVPHDACRFDQQRACGLLGLQLQELFNRTFDHHHSREVVDVAGQRYVLLVAVDPAFLRELVEVGERLAEDLETLALAS